MGRFRRSWELGKTSWAVLKKDRELMWLPTISFLLSGVIVLIVAGIVFLTEYDPTAVNEGLVEELFEDTAYEDTTFAGPNGEAIALWNGRDAILKERLALREPAEVDA